MTSHPKEILAYFEGDLSYAACESCGWETIELHIFEDRFEGGRGPRKFAVCDVCATTFASNAMRYPSQYPDHNSMKMIAWGINRILKEIKS